MITAETTQKISNWIRNYAEEHSIETLVVGVSGGIDSAVTSALCVESGIPTILVSMPIYQDIDQIDRGDKHIDQLTANHPTARAMTIDLTHTYGALVNDLPFGVSDIAVANTKARIRMTTLYAIAGTYTGIVVGTGNKVEDFGVGFFTKYGDGGVDIAPIADFYKSEVYELGKVLNVSQDILNAPPTDGLWADGRTDEMQMGASYEELEWAMQYLEDGPEQGGLNPREKQVLGIYQDWHNSNQHKMEPIPVYMRE